MAASRPAGIGLVAGQVDEREGDAVAARRRPRCARTSAGTITFSRLRRSRRGAPRSAAAPPAQVASTTSLGLTPKRRRTARRSPSERVQADVVAARRAGAVQRRARRGREQGVRERAGAAAREAGQPRAERSARRTGVSASVAPSAARSTTARASRSAAEGAGAGVHARAAAGRAGTSASGSNSSVAELDHRGRRRPCSGAPCRRSRCAPPGSESAIHISHSGRSRASGVERTASTIALRSSPAGRQEVLGGVEAGVVDPHRAHAARTGRRPGAGGSAARARGARRGARTSSAKVGLGPSSGGS